MVNFPNPMTALTQLYPPKASFTPESLPDLTGKVYIVTGGTDGIGLQLSSMLYSRNASVWMAARSETKGSKAVSNIQSEHPSSKGKLTFLPLDLADLDTVKASADKFLAAESRLDVLYNNAGVLTPPAESRTKQGYEMQIGVNNLGPFLFTQLLTPTLISTAKTAPANGVRVVWVSSSAAEAPFTPAGGVALSDLESQDTYAQKKPKWTKYGISKACNYLHAAEYAKRHKKDGLVSVALNPGNLKSDLWREQGALTMFFLNTFALHEPINGAYTELYAGLSPEVTVDKGSWIIPWGRTSTIRKDLSAASRSKEEGGTGNGLEFWNWSEEQVKKYL